MGETQFEDYSPYDAIDDKGKVAERFEQWQTALKEHATQKKGGIRPPFCRARVEFAPNLHATLRRDLDDAPEGQIVEVNMPSVPGSDTRRSWVAKDKNGAIWLIRQGDLNANRRPNSAVHPMEFSQRTGVAPLSDVRVNGSVSSRPWYAVACLAAASGERCAAERIQTETERFFRLCQLARGQLDLEVSEADLKAGRTGYTTQPRSPIEVRCIQNAVLDKLERMLETPGLTLKREDGSPGYAVDLLIERRQGNRAIVEAKTAIQSYDVYTGLGQLLHYDSLRRHKDAGRQHDLYLLLPDAPEATLQRTLKEQGVTVLRYKDKSVPPALPKDSDITFSIETLNHLRGNQS